MIRRIAVLGLIVTVTAGCQSPRPRQPAGARPLFVSPGAPVPAGQGFVPPGAPAPVTPGAPTPFPMAPQGPTAVPNNPPPQFPMVPQSPSGVPGASGKIESNWQPAEARSPNPSDNRVLLGPPEADGAKADGAKADVSKVDGSKADGSPETQKRAYPPQVDGASKLPATSLPVGIAQFAQVTPKVSAGLRPALDEGLDWLKSNNYRTIVHLRLPGENDAADRKEVEQRGLTYVSLEVSPNLLTKETVDEFVRLVRDPKQQPTFVYDRDGALAGGLWYLWFRLVEEAPDEVARIRARSLGLREDREGAHRDMWQSAQRYLADLKTR